MTTDRTSLSYKKIFSFWAPLASTWLMMSVEGPFLSAIIARLPEPKYNLAAYGVVFSLALFMEAPIIMIMSASTALAKNRDSFLKLRRFTYSLNTLITFCMGLLLLPPIFNFLMRTLIGLPPEVTRLTHLACLILLPWPAAIGYRRFYQGIMIRSNLTRRVAYGTVIRLLSMATVALLLYSFIKNEGVIVGAAALSAGVLMEAIASGFMSRGSVSRLLSATKDPLPQTDRITYGYILKFYYPLALTSILGLGVHPMVTFFLGHSRMALESLAVFPVINSLVFIFRSIGLSYQEVGIALLGENNEGYPQLRNFAFLIGLSAIASLACLAFTPLASIWYHQVSGLSGVLTRFAIPPTRIFTLMPGLTVLLSFQRAVLVNARNTRPITFATLIEVGGIVLVLFFLTSVLDLIGAVAAAIALVLGRLAANIYLTRPYFLALNRYSFR
ncbi:MAG: hypothetical protein Kow0042_11420 [Calditrichia bacterium]